MAEKNSKRGLINAESKVMIGFKYDSLEPDVYLKDMLQSRRKKFDYGGNMSVEVN